MIHTLFLAVPRGPHDEITRQAAEAAGWPRRGVRSLLAAVRRPDMRDFRWRPRWRRLLRIDATPAYRARHHADRVPPADDEDAWLRAARYIHQERQAAAAADGPEAVRRLGRALHAAQDVFSHSNLIALPQADQEQAMEALLHVAPPPEGLRLTAFAPGTSRPGEPRDPFPHAHAAKDAPGHNAAAQERHGGRTGYEAARDAATGFSQRLIVEFLASWSGPRRALVRRGPWMRWRAQR